MHSKLLQTLLIWSIILSTISEVKGHGAHEDETKAQPNSQRLLIISLDGFRHDFLDLPVVPNLQQIANHGVRAKSLQSAYITKTFPNHYTIASGLYEESHGIVANSMWDSSWNLTFDHCSDPTCGKWYGGMPIWQANEQAAKSREKIRASGVIHWPGTGAHINNVSVTHEERYPSKQFNSCVDRPKFRTSINKMINLMTDKEKPLNLGMIYHQEPDCTSHQFGPDSNETHQILKDVDDDIGYLLSQLKEHQLDINIIVLSDHGFATINNTVYLLEDCKVDVTQLKYYISQSPVILLWPKNDVQLQEVKKNLERCSQNHPIAVYEKGDDELRTKHYSKNIRISPLIVTTYHLDNRTAPLLKFNTSENWTLAGNHGWNNSWLAMHAFFIAKGPIFKKGYVKDTFSNIHVFSLFCSILDIKSCPPNNGSLSAVSDMLVKLTDGQSMSAATVGTIIFVALFCTLVSGIMSIGACRLSAKSRSTKPNTLLPQRHESSGLLPNGKHPETSDDEF